MSSKNVGVSVCVSSQNVGVSVCVSSQNHNVAFIVSYFVYFIKCNLFIYEL